MIEINNKTRSKIDQKLIRNVTERFLREFRINKDVSLAFVGDTTMRRLNREYRGSNRPTDVLAFTDNERGFFGEIIIDYAQIKRQAPRFAGSARRELVFILVHGLLHLLGYDDATERGRQEMERLGRNFINELDI